MHSFAGWTTPVASHRLLDCGLRRARTPAMSTPFYSSSRCSTLIAQLSLNDLSTDLMF